jgi:hypothetical protein
VLLTPVVVLFFLKAENNFCHFVSGAEVAAAAVVVVVVVVADAEVLADEELPVDEGVVIVGVEDVDAGVEKVTLWVEGDAGGCCCCRG